MNMHNATRAIFDQSPKPDLTKTEPTPQLSVLYLIYLQHINISVLAFYTEVELTSLFESLHLAF